MKEAPLLDASLSDPAILFPLQGDAAAIGGTVSHEFHEVGSGALSFPS